MNPGVKAHARLIASFSKKLLLQLFRVFVMLSLSLFDCWKMLEKEFHNQVV